MLEIETKYRLTDESQLRSRLVDLGSVVGATEVHADTYFQHPARDFVASNEALRIRTINSVASVTYKGPKRRVDGSAVKARQELEWCLAPGDADGGQMQQLLVALGFTPVATVRKERQSFTWPEQQEPLSVFTLTIDHVDEVGDFAEIELLVDQSSEQELRAASERIDQLAVRLGLCEAVRESYLELLLRKRAESSRAAGAANASGEEAK
jgi:adenylate cyclase class 2